MERKIIYRKVYIKSEDDLPKKAGNYFFCYKDSTRETRFGAIHYYTSRGDVIFWLKQVDWYLQEVELPTEEEIKKEIFKRTTEPIPYTGKDYIPKSTFQFMEEISGWLINKILGK